MEYKTILTGLFERLSGFREKRPHAGRKYELLGIISDMGNVIWQLKNDVLQRVMQEAPVDVDVDIDYTEMANRALQLELPERPSDWEDYEATSDSSDGLWLEDRMDDEAVEISIRVISDVNRLSMTQLARVANETLSKLNSVMVQIVEGLARRHSNEEYVRLYESEKRRYLKSRTASRAKQKYDEWLDICFGEPTLENIDDYRLEKLLHMFEQGGVQAKADHVQRATHYSGEFDFTQIDDDVKRKLAYKHYAALRQMTDWQNGCLVVIPSRIGQFFFVSRHDENAKGRRNVLLKYLHKIDMAQEERRRLLAREAEALKRQSIEDEELNLFAPANSLKRLLAEEWFSVLTTNDKRFNTKWTQNFVDDLMKSEYGNQIARDWTVRDKRLSLKCMIIGKLKDAGVLKGSYNVIARQLEIDDENPATLAKYMGLGKKQPFAEWVEKHVFSE